MVESVKRVNLLLAVLFGLAVLHLGAPRVSWGCGCCACDFGGGDVECGDGDTDCGLCIVLGGVPAASCDACESDCTSETLCAGDQQMCSTDVSGGCCIGSEFGPGCFVMTAAACAGLSGVYRGDGSNCDAPCPAPNGSACTASSDCDSTFCADGVCCDTACAGPLETCNLSGEAGTCVSAAAPAPALTPWGLLAAGALLMSIAAFALRRRMRSH